MIKAIRQIPVLVLLPLLALAGQSAYGQDEVLAIDWVDLMSQKDLDAILDAPEMSHESYGWQEQLENNPNAGPYMEALQSFDVNPDLVNKRVMLPGFIVPTAYDEERRVTEFFLVPFFGACLHLPPPPPNQIIHVTYERGVELENFYDAHVVHGLLSSEVVRHDVADSAYRMEAEGVSLYSY